MKLKNPKDFWAGIMFMAIGLAFAIIVKAFEYPMGTTSRMGPGYFPFVLGILMAVLGAAIIFESLATEGGPVNKFAWRPLVFILGAVVIFGLIVKLAGMAISIIILVTVAAFGGHEIKLNEVVIAGVVLAIFSVLVFVYGLKLSFPIWPAFISG